MADTPNVTATGVLKIDIPEPATTLTLNFVPSSDGDTWDAGRLASSLRERGITEGINQATLQRFLKRAATSDRGISEEILTGIPPQEPKPDTVEWDTPADEPEEAAAVREQTLAGAPAPEIYIDRTEKIETEKEVPSKGNVLFGRPKGRTEKVVQTITKKERIHIDPKVLQSYFVEESARLGRIIPREIGIPGKDIFGKTIPVKKLADPAFYHGPNIRRDGDQLIAERSGFLRIGRNWADIVPFAPHRWTVELSRDKATCYLVFVPGHHDSPLPDAGAIRSAAIELPYPEESLISRDEIARLIRGQIETEEPGRLPITLSRDAAFDIYVTEDKLSAYLNLYKGKGRGTSLKLKEVGAAIKSSGLKNLELKQIAADITAFVESPDFDLTGYLLCEGSAPTPGPVRNVECAPDFDDEKTTRSIKERLRGVTDFESIGVFPPEKIEKTARVSADQLICTIDPPVPGEPGRDVYGMIIPGEVREAPEIELHENLLAKDAIVVSTVEGVLDYGKIDNVVHLRVRPHVDATVSVTVSDDAMTAYLNLTEGSGTGTRLSRKMIDKALSDARVVHGIQNDQIEKALEAAQAGAPVEGVIVANGTAAIDQSENRLEFLIDISDGPGVRIRKDGTADYRTRKTIKTVEKDQPICRILPSQQKAIDGTDVMGKKIPAKQVSNIELELGENVKREQTSDGGYVVKSTTNGELSYAQNRIDVQTVHTVTGDVDMKIGNIKFNGSVTISGTVRTGFYVVSGGDIKIAGGVEGALLSADGDILIKQGVKGGGKAVLRSKQNIMSPFVELATVLSVGDVTLKSSVVRSRIKCNGKVTFQGDKGRIVGGQIRARNGLEVTSVGSPRGVKTHLSFGQDYLIADLIEKEEQEIEKVKRRISEVDVSMRKHEKAGTDVEALQTLRKEKVKLLKLMEKRGLRLFTLRERFEQHFPSKIVIKGDVHTGTVFESHGRTYEVTHPRSGVAVQFNAQTGNLDVNDLKDGSET